MPPKQPPTIECPTHGIRSTGIVCKHQLATDTVVGFVENSPDPDDLQAWCDDCEQMFLREKELTPAFREFNDFAVVCEACYARIKKLHTKQRH